MSRKVKVNLGQAETQTPLPEGIQEAVVREVSLEESDNGPYLAFTFDVPEYPGRQAWLNTSLQAQARWALKRTLVALGVNSEAKDIDLDELLDCPCLIQITHEKFQGETRHRVSRVLKASPRNNQAAMPA